MAWVALWQSGSEDLKAVFEREAIDIHLCDLSSIEHHRTNHEMGYR